METKLSVNYYRKWVEEFPCQKQAFKLLSSFEDIVKLSFKEGQGDLYFYLGPSVSLVFYDKDKFLFPTEVWKPLTGLFNIHLNHAVLKDCRLLNDDKIIELHFSKWNIYNQEESLSLIIELIPRYQNVILVTKRLIVDCTKKISFAENQTRQILPGGEYVPPKTEYVHIKETMGGAVNAYFMHLFFDVELEKKKETLKKSIINEIDRELKKANNKLAKHEHELASANELSYWSQCVELLKSSLHLIKSGMTSVRLTNYFAEDFSEIEIKLNDKISPQKNLEYYVKKYKKACSGQKIIAVNIKKTRQEIEELKEKREEILLVSEYLYLKNFKKENSLKSKTTAKKLFRVLPVSEDWEILIGRSSKENDLLTCKTAKPEDWWFHTRIFQGTHVVLRNFKRKEPSEDMIVLCCRLAAFYSKAKNSSNVPVDYTKIRYVRKPKGSPAGYVIYSNQKTLYAEPLDIRQGVKICLN
jgi:predicted ribosome quality control (RQC) complex YloA/Tae2 family protein